MKKTIATVALIAASSTSYGLMGPVVKDLQTACLKLATAKDASKYATACDESANNKIRGLRLKANGCAANQVAIVTYDALNIGKCMPPGAVQL